MASIIERKLGWQAKIRRAGFPAQSKTFVKKQDAEAWARQVESSMERGIWRDSSEAESTTLADALARYSREVTIRKKGKDRETGRIKAWLTRPIAKRTLASIRGSDMASFRDSERKRGMAENSVRIELALISHLFETARREWGMESLTNPVKLIKLPAGSNSRTRRLEGDEEDRLLAAIARAMPKTPAVHALVAVAIETGMRQGELLGLEWKDVDLARRVARLDDTKSGDPRDVPLTTRAVDTLSTLPRPLKGGQIFQIRQDALIRGFKRACKLAEIDGLTFHCLRHEAASRLAERLEAHELAKMLGWRTIQMAMRYYHPTAASLARKLG